MLRNKQKKIVIVFSTLVSFVLILGLFLNMSRLQEEAKTNTFNRIYKEDLAKLTRSFRFQEELGEIKHFNGELYLHDFQNQQIVKVDTLGNLLGKYNQKVDKHSRSFIVGWDVDQNGTYFANAVEKRIIHLGFDETVLAQYDFNNFIERAGRLKEEKFIISTRDLRDLTDTSKIFKISFVLVDVKNQSKKRLIYPLPDVEDSRMKLDGFFVNNRYGQTFYVCFMAGLFFSIDDEGKFLYLNETIDKTPLPKVLAYGSNRRFDPFAPFINRSAGADKNYLYILSNARAVETEYDSESSIVDVYQVSNGEYLWSFKIPDYEGQRAISIVVAPNGFYFRQGTNITYYSIAKNSQLW